MYGFLLVKKIPYATCAGVDDNGDQNRFQSSGPSKQTITVDMRWLNTVRIDQCTQEIVYDSIYTILH